MKPAIVKPKKPTHLESTLQIHCVKWLNLAYPKLAPLCFAIPNGHKRSKITAAILKREGVRAGVADLFFAKAKYLDINNSKWLDKHGLFIEMKVGKGKQTDAQLAFEKAVTEQGYAYRVVRTFDEFKLIIENW